MSASAPVRLSPAFSTLRNSSGPVPRNRHSYAPKTRSVRIQSSGSTRLSTRYLLLGLTPKRTPTAAIAATTAAEKSAATTCRTYVRIHAPGRPASQPARSLTAATEEESDTPLPTPRCSDGGPPEHCSPLAHRSASRPRISDAQPIRPVYPPPQTASR